jgi:hypothetical protein
MYDALAVVRPETVIRWHRFGFSSYWRWKSRRRCGRPTVTVEIRQLIRQMSVANPLWEPRESMASFSSLVSRSGRPAWPNMVRRRGPPSQGWRTFLRNHADGIAATDLFVVPTISFRLLYGLLIMGHGAGGSCCGSKLPRIQRPNGSPISSRRHAAGSKSRVTWSGIATSQGSHGVTGTVPKTSGTLSMPRELFMLMTDEGE